MSKKTIVALLVGIPAAYVYIQYAGSTGALYERFPTHDRKLVAKAHRQMLLEIVAGKHKNARTDEDYDAIYLAKYNALAR